MSNKEQLKRDFTDEECLRLVDYFSLLIEIDQQEKDVFTTYNTFKFNVLQVLNYLNLCIFLNLLRQPQPSEFISGLTRLE